MRFVVFIDGSCDLTFENARECYQNFCNDLIQRLSSDKQKIEQYLKDLNQNVSGKDTVTELMRQHKRAVELKDTSKAYMKLIFKQKIEIAKTTKKQLESLVSEIHAKAVRKSPKMENNKPTKTDFTKAQQQQSYVMNQQYIQYNQVPNQTLTPMYQQQPQQTEQILNSSSLDPMANQQAPVDMDNLNDFDLDESLFEDSPLDHPGVRKKDEIALESNTTEQVMDMNDSEEEPSIKPLSQNQILVKSKVAFTLQKKNKEKKTPSQAPKVQSIKSLLKKVQKKGRSRFGKKSDDAAEERYKPNNIKKTRVRKEEPIRSKSESLHKDRSSSRSFPRRSRSLESRSRSPIKRRRSLSTRSRSVRRFSRSPRRYSRSYSRDRRRKGSRSRSTSRRGRKYSRSKSPDSRRNSYSSSDRSSSRKRKRTRSFSKKRKRRKVKKGKKKRKLYSNSRSPSSSYASGSSSSDESSRSSSLGEDRWRPG